MKLTATQRTFITTQLGLKPATRAPVTEGAPPEPEGDGKDAAIGASLDDYLRREGKVLESLAALDVVAGAAELVAAFENEIGQIQTRVRTAAKDAADAVFKTAYQELDAIKARVRKEAETGAQNPTFFAKRDAVQKQIDALNKHPQKAHVQTLITEASTRLTEANQANDQKKYPESLTKLEAAKTAADKALDLGDKYNAYRIARAPVAGILAQMQGKYSDPTIWNNYNAKLTQADADATPAANKYAEATTALTTIRSGMSSTLQTWTQNSIKAQYQTLENGPEPTFIAADIQQLKDWHDSVPTRLAGGEWGTMNVLTTRALRFRVAATDRATRRKAYLDEKKKATDAITPLKANPAMATQVTAFEKVLTDQADPLATAQAQRFEEAIALCQKVVKDCTALAGTAAASKKFADDRTALEARLKTLQALPAAAQMPDAVKSLTALLAEADKCAAPDKTDWTGGQQYLDRLKADLTTAEGLAASLAGAIGAQAAVEGAGKAEDITKAAEQIRAEVAKLDVAPYKDLLAKEIKAIRDACTQADGKNGDGKLEEARTLLAGAADGLAKAQNITSLRKGYDDGLAAIKQRQETLATQAKTGSYTAILPKVNLIKPQIDQAEAAAKTHDYAAASAALVRASLAAQEADAAVAGVKDYDTRATPLKTRAATMKSGGSDVGEVETLLTQAATAASQLKFAEAKKLLDQAEAKMEALKIKALAKANPNDADIATTAEALLKLDGGDKMLDDFVKTLSGDASFGLIAKLAEKRFGITLDSDAGAKTLSAKAMWDVMANLPPSHATKSPSLKSIKREDPDGGSGGAYSWYDKSVTMNGRVNDGGTEKFDTATRKKALGIPEDHDNDADPYAPVDDTPANLFNMTTLHEVGHAVDDRLHFMNSRAGVAEFGGWVQYTDLNPIATAVATAKKYDQKYVLQLINGYTPEPAAMPDGYEGGEVKWAKAKKAVDDWYVLAKTGEIWYDYGKSKAAEIGGVVYQEAYANRWVSYVLAERAKGVTAYQWRAPGEWFAELYMCWYGKKLKDNHPFASWLKTL